VNTTINNLDEAIADILEDYSTAITNAVNEQTEKAANQLKKDIAADSPVKTGKQKKSWRVTKEKVAGLDLKAIVHSTDYRKVHLLENGHLTRDGVTRTKPIRYVSTNEEKIIKQYEQAVATAIKAVK
jgi:hypothetical protein